MSFTPSWKYVRRTLQWGYAVIVEVHGRVIWGLLGFPVVGKERKGIALSGPRSICFCPLPRTRVPAPEIVCNVS